MLSDPDADPLSANDDLVAPFALDGEPVRGRIARFGAATVDEILSRHNYHPVVATLLGEMLVLATLVGSSLKFDGKLIVQAQSQQPDLYAVPFIVAEYRTNGTLRGYARVDDEALAVVLRNNDEPSLAHLFGSDATFTMTIDQGEDADRYQGTVPLEGQTLADAAAVYFSQSEQVPTRIRIACAQFETGGDRDEWRAGGVLLQQVAGDSARGDSTQAWETAAILFETLSDDELVDPYLSAGVLLFRLFHEDGVRLFEARPVETACTCSRERILAILEQFGADAAEDMVEGDGFIRVKCEYCSKSFDFRPNELGKN